MVLWKLDDPGQGNARALSRSGWASREHPHRGKEKEEGRRERGGELGRGITFEMSINKITDKKWKKERKRKKEPSTSILISCRGGRKL